MRDEDIMRHTRHRDLRTMCGYVQRAGLLTESPARAARPLTGIRFPCEDGLPSAPGAWSKRHVQHTSQWWRSGAAPLQPDTAAGLALPPPDRQRPRLPPSLRRRGAPA
jgi:hypothetical protein